jgi:hypothetical protein
VLPDVSGDHRAFIFGGQAVVTLLDPSGKGNTFSSDTGLCCTRPKLSVIYLLTLSS